MTLGYRVEDVEAAEKVYREARELFWEAQAQKPPKKMPPRMKELVSAKMLEMMQGSLREQSDQGAVVVSGNGRIAWIKPYHQGDGDSLGQVTLATCVDQSEIFMKRNDGATAHGLTFKDYPVMTRNHSGGWVFEKSADIEKVDRCSAS